MGQESVAAATMRRVLSNMGVDCGRRDGDAKSGLNSVRGGGKRGSIVRIAATLAGLAAALSLGACGGLSLPDVDSFRLPDTSTLFRPYSVTSFKDKQLAPIAPEDLVDAEGRCAGLAAPAESVGEQPAGQTNVSLQETAASAIPAVIAIDMTECEMVKHTGMPQRVEIGSDGGERSATLTYLSGPRPGIYRFAAGRLKSMERGPEPPPEPKPSKRAPRSKQTAIR